MKKFLLWTLVICMTISMGMFNVTALADGVSVGIEYHLDSEGWPTKHWVFMTAEEVASFEANGWQRETGVLWMFSDGMSWYHDAEDARIQNVQAEDVQELYNDGYTFHVFYTWICPEEVRDASDNYSVTVGQWILSPDEAAMYHNAYAEPEISLAVKSTATYDSEWYYNGVSADFNEETFDEELNKFMYVRHIYELFDFGFGSKLYLRNGETEAYTYAEVLNEYEVEGGFFAEMPNWR